MSEKGIHLSLNTTIDSSTNSSKKEETYKTSSLIMRREDLMMRFVHGGMIAPSMRMQRISSPNRLLEWMAISRASKLGKKISKESGSSGMVLRYSKDDRHR
jgi:hypothetical protein